MKMESKRESHIGSTDSLGRTSGDTVSSTPMPKSEKTTNLAKESQSGDFQSSKIKKQSWSNLISPRSLFKRLMKGIEERNKFVESHISKGIAYQIRSLRSRDGLTQGQLAERVG